MGKYFGTDGFRGYVGKTLTTDHAYRIGRYLGSITTEQKPIFIGRDTRISSPMLTYAFSAGAMSTGAHVIDLGVITTPAISFLIQRFHGQFGVMISASHNPYYDNGIKLFNHLGEKLNGEIELAIEHYLDQTVDSLSNQTSKLIGTLTQNQTTYHEAYLNFLKGLYRPYQKKLKVLVDCANGSASVLAPTLFSMLGIDATFIHAEPNGININERCGATHLQSLQASIKKGSYDLGLAFDGDADRLLAVTAQGEEVNGDGLLYLHSQFLFKEQPNLEKKVVITQMSNFGLKKAFQQLGIGFIETNVGDKYVQAALKKEQLIIGGEQSGHIIFLNELNTGDGFISAVKLLNILQQSQLTLQELVISLKRYPQLLKNIAVENKTEVMNHPELMELIRRIEARLGQDGRVLVRPSGTEQLIRVMVEALAPQQCQQIVDEVVTFIEETFIN
jgi:phosphoglucosamine mutase